MTIEAVVVTYNSAKTIQACLDSLARAGIATLIVDSASTDNTASIVTSNQVPLVILPKNLGFSAAANTGAKQSHAEAILFLNPDALVPGDTKIILESAWAQFPKAGVVGFLLVDVQGKPEANSFGDPVTPWSLLTRRASKQSVPTKPKLVGWVSGGAMVVRKDVWQLIGGFDEEFFMYWEDVDLCTRAQLAGYDVILVPTVRVRHQRGASLANQKEKTRLYDTSADKYLRKHYAFPIWGIYYLLRRLYRLLGFRVS